MNFKYFILIITLFFLISCAQQVPLTGGDKDIEPPKEVESFPPNGSTKFNAYQIEIEFNEFIQTQNLNTQLIVSPLMETPPEVMVKNKKLVIKLKDTLLENTTYSLNFGGAITDITENNPFPNYKYVFSTGDYVDSLSYSGSIINAKDLTPKENIYILLYNQFEDSVPLKEKPRYIAVSDKDGNYNITNIAPGQYKLFAINDINGNYLFDLPNEDIAFSDDLITINESSKNNILNLFQEENSVQYVVKSEHKKFGKIDIVLNIPPTELTITPLVDLINPWSVKETNINKDTLSFWLLPNITNDELDLEIKDDNEVIDTLNFTLINQRKFKDSALVIQPNVSGQFDLNKNLLLKINRPIDNFYSDSLILFEDSIAVNSNQNFTKTDIRNFKLKYNFKENTKYHLIIPPNTFEDIYGIKNDTTIISFNTKKITDYGTIALKIAPNFSENYIVQLRKNKNVVQQDFISGSGTINYKYLKPGNYQLKLIIDTNGDKKWTTGNYINNQQPEKIIFYEKDIAIRANWDNEINWIIKK